LPSSLIRVIPVAARTTPLSPAIALIKFLRKSGWAISSLSAIQMYSPFAKENPFCHCLNVEPEFSSLYTICDILG